MGRLNLSTRTAPSDITKNKIDIAVISAKSRNWVMGINNKYIENPRRTKQRKIVLADIQIKLKPNRMEHDNDIPYDMRKFRKNHSRSPIGASTI